MKPRLSLPGTRLSEQPIHSTRGALWLAMRSKKAGSSRSTPAFQARLLAMMLARMSSSAMSACQHARRLLENIVEGGLDALHADPRPSLGGAERQRRPRDRGVERRL